MPSLEVFHEYRVAAEHTDGTGHLLELPAFVPSHHKNLRADRSPDAAGTHPEMLYCEFKGCSIMVYGKIGKCPVGASRFPGWESIARPARITPGADPKGQPKGKGKGKSKDKSADKPPKGKSKGRGKGAGKGKPEEDKPSKPDPKGPNVIPKDWKDCTYDQIPLSKMHAPLMIMWRHMCRELQTYLLSELYGSLLKVPPKGKSRYHPTNSRITSFGAFQMKMLNSGTLAVMATMMSLCHQVMMIAAECVQIPMRKN